ncbi:MAG: DegT/DnrJ/EryC1/StrS family aminotransferase [Nanoarchaeota archaeon]
MNKYRIKFGDGIINEIAKKHLQDCINAHWISQGPKVTEFENKWGELFGYKYNIAVSNGTDADIHACAALYDLGAQRGDEIIAPALAFIAIGNSILASGFKPVFVDVEKHTLNINPNLIEEKITPKTKAIMVVHTMGKPCEMEKIIELAKKHNLFVIEDSCEAHGATYKGKIIGSFGDLSTFSCYAAHLIWSGEGGMISTNSEDIANILKSARNHGRESIYFDHVRFGLNSRMSDLHASVGLGSLTEFKKIFNKRKENLYHLLDKTKDLQELAFFNLEEPHEIVAPHAFSITLKDPKYNYNELYSFLESVGIQCKRNFGSIPTQHKAFSFLGYKFGDFPEAEYIGDNGLHIGVHQYLSLDDLNYISDKLHEYFNKFK